MMASCGNDDDAVADEVSFALTALESGIVGDDDVGADARVLVDDGSVNDRARTQPDVGLSQILVALAIVRRLVVICAHND